MAIIVPIDFAAERYSQNNRKIDVTEVMNSRRQLRDGLIKPAEDVIEVEVADDHTSEPIKDINDIQKISDYLVSNGMYRDNMFFIVGINFGLRVSDLTTLRFGQLIDDNLSFRSTFPVLEKKTKNTRKVKKNRYITINEAVMDAVTLYLRHNDCKLDDYLFKSESNRGSNRNEPMSRTTAHRIMKNIQSALGLDIKMSTHTLRKTFAYHQMVMSNNDPRKLLLLQKMFGHSSAAQTLDYIGITRDEIEEAYMNLNLGSKDHYLVNSKIEEGA